VNKLYIRVMQDLPKPCKKWNRGKIALQSRFYEFEGFATTLLHRAKTYYKKCRYPPIASRKSGRGTMCSCVI